MNNQVVVDHIPGVVVDPLLLNKKILWTIKNHENWTINFIEPVGNTIQFELIDSKQNKYLTTNINWPEKTEEALNRSVNENKKIVLDYLLNIKLEEITILDMPDGGKYISFGNNGINMLGAAFAVAQIVTGAVMIGTGLNPPIGSMMIGSGGNSLLYTSKTEDKDFSRAKYLGEAATGFFINGILSKVSLFLNGASFLCRATGQLVASVGSNTLILAASDYCAGKEFSKKTLEESVKQGVVNGVAGAVADFGFNSVIGPAANIPCKFKEEAIKKCAFGAIKGGITKVATNAGENMMGKNNHLLDGVKEAAFIGAIVNGSIGIAEKFKFERDTRSQLLIEKEQAHKETQKALFEAEKTQKQLDVAGKALVEAQLIVKQKLINTAIENHQTLIEKQELVAHLESLNGMMEQNNLALNEQQLSIAVLRNDELNLRTELMNIQTEYDEIDTKLSRLQHIRAKQEAFIEEKINLYKHGKAQIHGQTVTDPEIIKNAYLNGEKVQFKIHHEKITFKFDEKFTQRFNQVEQAQNTQKQHLEGQRNKITSTESTLVDQQNKVQQTLQQNEIFKEERYQKTSDLRRLENKIQQLPVPNFSKQFENIQQTMGHYDHAVENVNAAIIFEKNLIAPLHLSGIKCDPLSANLIPLRPTRKLLYTILAPEPVIEITDCEPAELFKHIVLVQGINDREHYTHGYNQEDLKATFCLQEPDLWTLTDSEEYRDLRSLFALLGVISKKGEIGHHLDFEKRELEKDLINRPTVHWCWNKLVEANINGDWENFLIAVLEPYMDFESKEIGKPFNLAPYDTFTFGSHKLSKNSIILIRKGLVPDQLKYAFDSHFKGFQGKFVFYPKNKTLREAVIDTLNNNYADVWHMCDQDGILHGNENIKTDGGYRDVTCIKTKEGKIIQVLKGQNTKGKALEVEGRMVELHTAATKTILRFSDSEDKYFKELDRFKSAIYDRFKKEILNASRFFDVIKGETNASNPIFAGKVKQTKNLLGMGSLHCIEVCKRLKKYDQATGCHIYADYLIKQALLADIVSLFYENYPNRSADELSRFDFKLIIESQLPKCTSLLKQILNKLNGNSASDMKDALILFDKYATLLEEATSKCEKSKAKMKETLLVNRNIKGPKIPAMLMIGEDEWIRVSKPNQIEFDIGINWPLTDELNAYKDAILPALPHNEDGLIILYHILAPSNENNKDNYQKNVIRGLICAVMQEYYFQTQYEASPPTVFLNKLKKTSEVSHLLNDADELFIWRSHVLNIMSNPNFTSTSLLEALSQKESLKTCYSKSAGVYEEYTVGQHTQRVIDIAQKYRHLFVDTIEFLVNWEQFLLFLALHDIGKGISKEEFRAGNSQGLSAKQLELKYCSEILESTMKDLKVSPPIIKIFNAMLMYDCIGDYLQCDTDLETITSKLLEMALSADCHPLQFYQLFRIFHLVDAASYPSLKDFFKIEENVLGYSEVYQEMIDVLTTNLKK